MDKLFIINFDVDELDDDWSNDIICSGIYTDLETAKNELKNICNNNYEYKFLGYKIMVYNLVGNKYIFTNKIYTYTFDEFIECDYNKQ
jgi:hypothetical protein